jgi:hypothetical protein
MSSAKQDADVKLSADDIPACEVRGLRGPGLGHILL